MSSGKNQKRLGKWLVNLTLLLLVLIWTIPTLGIFISSFRNRDKIATTGWWNVFPHREWRPVSELDPKALGLNPDEVMEIEGVSGTFDQFRKGIETPDGKRVAWIGNKRLGKVEVQENAWTIDWDFSLDNYEQVLGGQDFEFRRPDGSVEVVPGDNMVNAFLNSLAVAIPSTVIPILIAAFAAYAFAWMKFPGRRSMFIMVVALLVVPLQIALVPILRDYRALNLNGTFLAIWLAHTGFGLALATYLLYNYISSLPRDILESAFIDGASHFTVFTTLVLPLSVPALASFAIFQFLWVWNDYLVALIFLGGNPEFELVTQRMAAIVGARGQDWHLLTAGAFVSMILPLTVFFTLQRFFVRGLLAGSVKG
ncbi:MAG: carbohydrate ABC transporter permease [Anaerolineales bacterium]|nr:MAG: carbohydrate ABC transporter permease [Chloroflexota bacterium]MBE7433667.1 carbohydrate ABC transporter permease [Anaerolineales bacterium]MCK6583624.1 carbohydrate ABC transporter permease [Anaerolineales bacterium]